MRKTSIIYVLLVLAVACFVMDFLQQRERESAEPIVIERVDTIRDTILQVRDSVVVRNMIVRLPVVKTDTINHFPDTTKMIDSADVVIPITQKTYSDDSTYTAWISGYNARLDSIEVYRKFTEIRYPKPKPKRWGVGLQVGAGYNGKVEPYVGVGVSYNLFTW